MASGARPGWKVTHSGGVRWPANLEVSLGLAQDSSRPLVKTKGCGLGAAPRRGQAFGPRESTCCRPQPDPLLASRARRSRPPLCSPARAGKLSPPAPRESLPGRTPIPRGGGEPDCARGRDDAGRAPPRRPAQIAFKTSASPPPTAGQGAGAGRGGRRRHVPPRRPAPRLLVCPPTQAQLSPYPEWAWAWVLWGSGVLPNRNLHFYSTFSSLGSPSFYLTQSSLAAVDKTF